MKKILALFVVLLVAMMVFACNGNKNTTSTTSTTTPTTEATQPTTKPTTATSATTATTATTKPTTASTATTKPTTATTATTTPTTQVTSGVVVDLDFGSITNNVIKDKSENGNDATLTGNATVADGKITFAASGAYLTIKNNPNFCFAATDSFTLQITFAAAANPQEFHSWPTLLSMGDKGKGWFGIWAPKDGFQWGGDLIDPKDNTTNIKVGAIDEATHTLTVIQDGKAGKIYIYFDGVLVTETAAINHSSTGDLFIGGGTYSGSGKFDKFGVQQFKGSVSEFKIWNYATEAPKAPAKTTDELFTEAGYDLEKYTKVDLTPVAKKFYNSKSNGTTIQVSAKDGDTGSKFWTNSTLLTKEQIPVGSVIVVKEGYQYRPEAWTAMDTKTDPRPAEVQTTIVVVDEAWWADYTLRAFNVSTNNSAIADRQIITEADFDALTIYVPKATEPEEPDTPDVPDVPEDPDDPALPEGIIAGADFATNTVTDNLNISGTPVVKNGALVLGRVGDYIYVEGIEAKEYTVTITAVLDGVEIDVPVAVVDGVSTNPAVSVDEDGILYIGGTDDELVIDLPIAKVIITEGVEEQPEEPEIPEVPEVELPEDVFAMVSGGEEAIIAGKVKFVGGTPVVDDHGCLVLGDTAIVLDATGLDAFSVAVITEEDWYFAVYADGKFTVYSLVYLNADENGEAVVVYVENTDAITYADGIVTIAGDVAPIMAVAGVTYNVMEDTAVTVIPKPYVDMEFDGNTAVDLNGNANFVVKGEAGNVTTDEFVVKQGNKYVTVTGINIKSGAWVLGTFTNLANNTEVDAAVKAAGGFTVEAYYANNDPTSTAGIVCATEGNATGLGKQGWGIADASSAPYFITGVGSGWANTSQSEVKIAKSTLVHVVGVYDAETSKIYLYINGALVKEAAASTFAASAANEKYEGYHIGNTFGLGGDPTVTGSTICDFPAKDLVIVDANIYMGALTADEVATLNGIASLRANEYVNEKIYADIDFDDDTAYDAEGNVDFTVKGNAEQVTTGEYTVKYGTKDVTVTGINIKKGGWVLGTFNSLADNTVVDEAVKAAGGFTVEAFYANMNPTGFVGIVCATEGNAAEVNKAKQGWGLADNAKAPYFITGNGSWCTTNPSGANVEAGTLVHVVGVYDDAADKICLYVNGVCIKEAAATGFTVSGAHEKGTDENGGYLIGNTFGLGGDPTVQGGLCDYNAVDLIIVDAKIYMGALTAEDVAIAYTNAIAPYAG